MLLYYYNLCFIIMINEMKNNHKKKCIYVLPISLDWDLKA